MQSSPKESFKKSLVDLKRVQMRLKTQDLEEIQSKLNIKNEDSLTQNAINTFLSDNYDFVTHNVSQLELIEKLRNSKLSNKKNNVKVIVYPSFLNGQDYLLDLNYYETISAAQLGVFPSYYEPYGYTPLESISMNVPAITTTNAGFGQFAQKQKQDVVFVINPDYKELLKVLQEFEYDPSDLKKCSDLAKKVDWKRLIKNYLKAYDLALKN